MRWKRPSTVRTDSVDIGSGTRAITSPLTWLPPALWNSSQNRDQSWGP
ncbi:hypothetical protein GA0115253_1075326 [Streptomyces sp. Termitarium-T10T-6]|nr:hypothetical protein GA0115253_1075326 [Streptomyces sp. Termitarium-T10T-6]